MRPAGTTTSAAPPLLPAEKTDSTAGSAGSAPEISEPADPPVWFRRKQSASPATAAAVSPPPPLLPPPTPPSPLSAKSYEESASAQNISPFRDFWGRLIRRTLGAAAVGYSLSVLLHTIGLIALGLWVLNEKIPLVELLIDGSKSVGIETELQEAPKIALTTQGGKPQPTPQRIPPSVYVAPHSSTATLSSDLTDSIDRLISEGTGQGQKKGPGDGEDGKQGAPFGGPKKGNAVTRGSFTAWTVPEKPKIRQPYFIIIEVKIPKKLGRRYSATDLSGKVVGTDDYSQMIPWDERLKQFGDPRYIRHTFRLDPRRKTPVWLDPRSRNTYLPVIDGKARLIIKVPGASVRKIQDTITIHSKLLNEKQTLKIVF